MYDDEEYIEIEVTEIDESIDLDISENHEDVGVNAEDAVLVSHNQDKTVTPSSSQQIVEADSGYTGLGKVTVAPIPSNYGLVTWDGSILMIS